MYRWQGGEPGADELNWLDAPDGVLAVSRPGGFACVVNLSAQPVPLLPRDEPLLTSGPRSDGMLSPDTVGWLRTGG